MKPNFVTKNKNRRFSCDCLGYHEKELCSHVLAVAEENGCLREMLTLTTVSSKRGPSLTNLVFRGVSAPAGKKPGSYARPRKRTRKASSVSKTATSAKKAASVESGKYYILRPLLGTQIRMCYGCCSSIRVPPTVPDPPHDMVIARKEFREFRDTERKLRVTQKKSLCISI